MGLKESGQPQKNFLWPALLYIYNHGRVLVLSIAYPTICFWLCLGWIFLETERSNGPESGFFQVGRKSVSVCSAWGNISEPWLCCTVHMTHSKPYGRVSAPAAPPDNPYFGEQQVWSCSARLPPSRCPGLLLSSRREGLCSGEPQNTQNQPLTAAMPEISLKGKEGGEKSSQVDVWTGMICQMGCISVGLAAFHILVRLRIKVLALLLK